MTQHSTFELPRMRRPITSKFRLFIQTPDGERVHFPITQEAHILLGGTHDCSERTLDHHCVRLGIHDAAVSAKHALVELLDGAIRVTDLGSRNGTWVAGAKIETAILPCGSMFIIGKSTIFIERIDDSPLAVTPIALPGVIGGSPSMQRVAHLASNYAGLSLPVLLRGESGCGKEVIAKAIHRLSQRAQRPFVAVNLATLSGDQAEAELFGAERGAYTGLQQRRIGCFEAAQGGTLFLDELGELNLDVQAKLLRVLECFEIKRLGSQTTLKVDVRIIAATWQPLEQRMREGRFRDDLFHRLNVLVVDIPSLRERRGDIGLLAAGILQRDGHNLSDKELTQAAISRLMVEPFPGNVRELRNVVLRAAALCPGLWIDAEHIEQSLQTAKQYERSEVKIGPTQETIAKALEQCNGQIAKAAKLLGMPRETLRDWVYKSQGRFKNRRLRQSLGDAT